MLLVPFGPVVTALADVADQSLAAIVSQYPATTLVIAICAATGFLQITLWIMQVLRLQLLVPSLIEGISLFSVNLTIGGSDRPSSSPSPSPTMTETDDAVDKEIYCTDNITKSRMFHSKRHCRRIAKKTLGKEVWMPLECPDCIVLRLKEE